MMMQNHLASHDPYFWKNFLILNLISESVWQSKSFFSYDIKSKNLKNVTESQQARPSLQHDNIFFLKKKSVPTNKISSNENHTDSSRSC